MNTKIFIAIATITTIFGSFNRQKMQSTKAVNSTAPDNYIRIGADQTDVAWITRENSQRSQDVQKRNPIIFFNANPKFEIEDIRHINYRISDQNGKTIDGKVSQSNNHISLYKSNRYVAILPSLIPWVKNTYEYQSGNFNTMPEESGRVYEFAYYRDHTEFRFPEIGKTRFISNDLSNFMGEKDADFVTRMLWEFKTSKTGYKNYQAFNVDKNNQNYKFYLILPLETVTNLTVEYLSLEAYDINGNIITDKIDIKDDTNPGSSASVFSFVKEAGVLKTTPAIYFPGNNKFKLVGYQMSKYIDNNSSKNFSIYLWAGDLVGKSFIELKDGVSMEFMIHDQEKKTLSYEFFGRNNSLLIDIPLEVTDVTIDIYFERMNVVEGEVLEDPFALNLTDVNGNYGIKGQLPLEDDPNKKENWFKKFFETLFGGRSLFDSYADTIQFVLTSAILILGIVFIFRFLPARRK